MMMMAVKQLFELPVLCRFTELTAPPQLKTTLGRLWLLRTLGWCSRAREEQQEEALCSEASKQASSLAKLKASRPPIPTLFLANICALNNKMDLLHQRYGVFWEIKSRAVLCLTETWLNNNMPNSAFQIIGLQLFWVDRSHLSGKTRGGGLVCT